MIPVSFPPFNPTFFPAQVERDIFKDLPSPFKKKDYTSHLPQLACNEENQSTTLEFFKTHPSRIEPHKRVHFGFSFWFNYDLMSVTTPAFAIVCDIDNHMMDLYRAVQESLKKSATRSDFIDEFGSYLLLNKENLGLSSSELVKLFDLEAEQLRSGSWLYEDRSFKVIKDLHHHGRIRYLNLDITDRSGSFVRLREWLFSNDLEVDTLYVSNINEWISISEKKELYIDNLRTISTFNTRFIHAYKPKSTGWPIQFIEQGVDKILFPSIPTLKRQLARSHEGETPCRKLLF